MADDLAQASQVITTAVDASQPVEEGKEATKPVEQLLQDGAQALAMGKFAEAVEHYAFAVEKLVEKHGEMAVETVDALEAYGNALLKNAISQSAVLGTDAAREKSAPAAESTSASGSAPAAASSSSSKPAPSSKGKEQEPLTANNINFHFGGDAPDDDEDEEEGGEEEQGEGGEEDGEGGDDDDFETAWNVLDTARAVLAKEESRERKLQLARVHSSMAEVATEAGRPEDGVKEYETALGIQSSLLEPYDRLVAQTHLFIALAHELVPTNQFDAANEEAHLAEQSFAKAIEHVQAAKGVLRNRERFLKGLEMHAEGKGKGKEGETPADGEAEKAKKELSEKDQEEIKDIEELQVELDNKIEDLRAQVEEAKTKRGSLQEQIYQAGPSLPEGVSKEVHNLNSLVKKKPKKENGVDAAPDAAPVADASASSTSAGNAEVAVNGKRKAEDEGEKEVGEQEKKVKVDARV